MKGVGIGWPIGMMSGWGIYGLNLVLQLAQRPGYEPILLVDSPILTSSYVNPLHRALLQPVLEQQQSLHAFLAQHEQKQLSCEFAVLQAIGKDFAASLPHITGSANIGIVFCEDSRLSPEAVQRASRYDRIIAGCTWSETVFKHYGLTQVRKVIQGIDPTVFHPAPRSTLFADRFVVFSGGKLEYRKGQDIVIAAFKAFHAHHPEALLLVAWHNFWSDYMTGLEQTGNVVGLPQVEPDGRLRLVEWLVANGLPAEAVIDLGAVPNLMMGQMMREADVAVFPNRCEAGTNLVAMECLACGVPTIISANTGHLDLIDEAIDYPLRYQKTVRPNVYFSSVEDWGESDVEEVVAQLEAIYGDRQTAQRRGQQAAQRMQSWSWHNQISQLLAAIDECL
jgi:glycosyltransferase involved in cell wall biosynthesis